MFFSSKYEPILKTFPTPHVLVFANFRPKVEDDAKGKAKLSDDRILLINLDEIGDSRPEPLSELIG